MAKARILLTRPESSNPTLRQRLETAKFAIRELPLLRIEALDDAGDIRTTILNIDHYSHIISTSRHASKLLACLLDQYWPQLPAGLNWYAMGPGSAAALEDLGATVKLPPTGHASETLLTHPELQQLAGQKVLIAKGFGGRTLLEEQLRDRGGFVQQLNLYKRSPACHDQATLKTVLSAWQPHILVVFSGESLQQFWSLAEKIGYAWNNLTVVVPSNRVASLARSKGMAPIVLTAMSDDAVIEAIEMGSQPNNLSS